MRVIFVGSNPSKENTLPGVPFLGTQSYIRLLVWIRLLDVADYVLLNVSDRLDMKQPTEQELNKLFNNIQDRSPACVVALGKIASEALEAINMHHFKLPHPSGRNRQINDKKYLTYVLECCKNWIGGHL